LKTTDKICTIEARRPQGDIIQRAAEVIAGEGIVVFPTMGLYGLGVDAFNAAAVARIFDLKGRDSSKPLLVMIHDRADLKRLVDHIDARTSFLMDRFWPGRVTFVLAAKTGLAGGLISPDGKIGVRLAGHPVAAALITAVGSPITATSANLSGSAGCTDAGQLDPAVLAAVDLVLDAGPLSGAPSTVIDSSGSHLLVLRPGAIPEAKIESAWLDFDAGIGSNSL
jgi:L-threonylcarbamoyladenylate synthase